MANELRRWWIIAAAIGAAASSAVAGLNPETGAYLYQHYSPKQYGASPQNWGMAEDRRGILYFANTDGLLEFDGTTWRMHRLPGGSIVRSVSVDDEGTIYVGGVGNFGLLQPDATGTLQFISLLSKVPQQDRAFADVWKVLPTAKGVYFSTTRSLLRLNKDGTIKVWRPERRFGAAFLALNSIYVQMANKGLLKLGADDRLTAVPGGERFAKDVIRTAASDAHQALIATTSNVYRVTEQGVELFPTEADAWLAGNLATAIQIFPDGEIAVGTAKGGVVVLSPAGAIDRTLSTANGLVDDSVSGMYVEPQNGVWLTQNNGITRINPGISKYGKSEHLEGDVQSMTRQGGAFYAGSTAGLFRLKSQAGDAPAFEHIEGIKSTTWTLAPYGKDVLAATDLGVFLASGKQAKRVSANMRTAFDLNISQRDAKTVYVAKKAAVSVLRQEGSRWLDAAQFEAPAEEFHTVLEDADGRVWATSKGTIWRLDFRERPVRAEKFGAKESVPSGWINARRLEGRVVFATTKGLKRYDEPLKKIVADDSLGSQFADGSRDVFNIFDDAAGNVWVTGEGYHGILRREAKGYKWFPMPLLRSGISEIYWMWLDADRTAWVTGADFVLHRWEPSLAGDPDKNFQVMTRRVQLMAKQKDWYGGAGKAAASRLPWTDNAVRFEFAAPFYEEPGAVEYQVRLEGSDADWTQWSHETRRDYTHLPEGSYRFQVRARTPHGTVSEDASIALGVLPPWYRTWWAYSFYVVFGGFGVWGIVRLRTRQLEEDKRKLEGIVEERTIEVRQQRDEIQVQEQKSQSLLLNILPAKVADELKTTGSVQPVAFEDVTVCFTDFVGFTVSSEKMAPGSLVDALNEYFTRFDEIIARYGLEKLKTIGDSYMFASGLPVRRASHAVDAVLAALEMVEVVKELGARAGGTGWNIRVGLHSGPVVAGVVGIRKFAFDIWGNTVNFAARMESSGVPGRVNLSERTRELTRGLIDCTARGHIKIKEGRELPMFLADGPAVGLLDREDGGGIPERFMARYREAFGEEPLSLPVLRNTAVSAGRG
jgi:class 3 adenylate cyclase